MATKSYITRKPGIEEAGGRVADATRNSLLSEIIQGRQPETRTQTASLLDVFCPVLFPVMVRGKSKGKHGWNPICVSGFIALLMVKAVTWGRRLKSSLGNRNNAR